MSFQRSTRDCKIAGICGSLAWEMDIEPLWVRLLFLVLFFCTPFPIGFIYIFLWILTDKDPY